MIHVGFKCLSLYPSLSVSLFLSVGFLVNFCMVLLEFCRPFFSTHSSAPKLPLIVSDYPTSSVCRLDLHNEPCLVNGMIGELLLIVLLFMTTSLLAIVTWISSIKTAYTYISTLLILIVSCSINSNSTGTSFLLFSCSRSIFKRSWTVPMFRRIL